MESMIILGRDARFDCLEKHLLKEGFSVKRHLEEGERGCFFLPLNAGEEEILSVIEKALPKSTLLAGHFGEAARLRAKEKKMLLIPLLEEEDYLTDNAAATAEGTLAAVIRETPVLLRELCVLVCGYGNCGRAVARLLWLCGCEVWIFSREGSMERAKKDGFNVYHAPGQNMGMFDVIVNTVPAPIFASPLSEAIAPETVLFQVASGLSGIQKEKLALRGIRFHPLPGLPGLCAPQTEADAMYRILKRYRSRTLDESE